RDVEHRAVELGDLAGLSTVERDGGERGDCGHGRDANPGHRHFCSEPRRFRSVGGRCEHLFVHGEATILHADLDAFYASVEQRDAPRLRGRPVIVGGGVVLAASYEAKAFGVRTAMGGRQARRLCPNAVVVPPRMSAYAEASKAAFAVFDDASPVVEGLSIDE